MMTAHARTGIPPSSQLPVAPVPGYRLQGLAAQVILWLLLIGVAAAAAYLLLEVMLAAVGGLGPHPPGWPLPHPTPAPNPAPAPPGS
jgi:hypothetical protein